MKTNQDTSLAAVVSGHGAQACETGIRPTIPTVVPFGSDLSALQLRAEDRSAPTSPELYPVHVFTDPYSFFADHGQRLHSCSISILPKARSNGVLYTGEFNIEGFIYTVGAPSVEGLFLAVMEKRRYHLQCIHRRQQRKRDRCALRYMERHPEAELPFWLN